MPQYQSIFNRIEIKYLLDAGTAQAFLAQIADQVTTDAFSASTIANLYYDTDDFQLIRSSIEKPVYKEKLRLRSYETPTQSSGVFVEIKKKVQGTVYKRRLMLPYQTALDYLDGQPIQTKNPQVQKEIDWFLHRYPLRPKAYISYERSAWRGLEDPTLRITFDKNILFRASKLDLSDGSFGIRMLDPSQTLMEIKLNDSMPLWLSHCLNDLYIFPTSYSKYGNCYKKYLLNHCLSLVGGTKNAS